ncbi:hypothetical protein E8E12_000977 [Didymella heteroderae]|uniref:Uncharacterized protein n=1 Tax=Didymella heteroderae TaxID=1769908 RepID=A0A9P4WHV0_9PLEO|nr:hypothetical protein E8E12_000977 [Didymella heteroderae]
MAGPKTALTSLRSLALAGAVVIFVLGMWSLVIVQAIDSSRGRRIFESLHPMIHSKLGDDNLSWSQFITAAQQSTTRIWILVITSLLTIVTTLAVIMSNRYYWLRLSAPAILSLEAVPTSSTIIAFACALSISLDLNAFNTPPLSTFDSNDLSFFAKLDPLSRGLTIASSVTLSLLFITSTAHLIIFLKQRRKEKDTRSFEPTVSALGMSHGFAALHPAPRTSRPAIPTIYDPYRAFKKGPGALQTFVQQPEAAHRPSALKRETSAGELVSKHVGFADEGAWMARKSNSRWSVSTASPRRMEGDMMKFLEVRKAKEVKMKKTRRAVPVRPASAAWYAEETGGAHMGQRCV